MTRGNPLSATSSTPSRQKGGEAVFARIYGAATLGLNGHVIAVETDISNGLPSFDLVGLAATSVKEAKERVRAAVKNSGYEFPMRRLTVNLAPADLKKDTAGLDLSLAVAILVSSGQIPEEACENCLFLGELALDGRIRPVNGILPMVLEGAAQGMKTVFVSRDNAAEALLCPDLTVYGVRPLALWDDDYPAWLPFTAQPPLVLFCQGTMGRDSSSLAIVGSRKASPYGLNAAESLAAELAAQGFTIISGGARGIDTRAHRGALKGKGRTVVVAANGLDRTYPRENKALFRQVVDNGGAVISEYAFGVEPLSRNFPARNRIIAGMAAATIVVEAALRSGSLITADLALDEGRDVFAMPGSVFSETSRGTNHLLQLGAIPLTCVDDVIREFRRRGWQGPETVAEAAAPSLSPAEQAVIDAIPFDRALPVSELLEKTGLSVSELLPLLLALQMKKAAEELPGGYIRCAAAFSVL